MSTKNNDSPFIIRIVTMQLFAVVACIYALSPEVSAAEPLCQPVRRVVSLSSTLATASIWANLWSRKDSISYVTERSFQQGRTAIAAGKACSDGCVTRGRPSILLEASPLKLHSPKSSPECAQRLRETEVQPLVFEKEFPSFDEIHNWFDDFSRGDGVEGELLYDLCDGGCSPRYRNYVTELSNHTFHMRTEVVCGLPRDKEDNRYHISLALVAECVSE